mgnify:CR=1 FL=1
MTEQEHRELDAQVAERVMGGALDWQHQRFRDLLDQEHSAGVSNREVNDGHGLVARCEGCGMGGVPADEMGWWGCPCPCPPRIYKPLSESLTI